MATEYCSHEHTPSKATFELQVYSGLGKNMSLNMMQHATTWFVTVTQSGSITQETPLARLSLRSACPECMAARLAGDAIFKFTIAGLLCVYPF